MILKCTNKDCNAKLRVDINKLVDAKSQIKCPRCGSIQTPFAPQKTIRKESQRGAGKEDPESTRIMPPRQEQEFAWIVVHDEQANPQTYELTFGKNTIGRRAATGKAKIQVSTKDPYMSRMHFVLEVKKNARGSYEYLLCDMAAFGEKASTNGTFLNENPRALTKSDIFYLKDGDVIQAGRTKLVLKTHAESKTRMNATDTVIGKDFAKTIIF